MKCAICGREMAKPMYGGDFKDVCNRCFDDRYWQLILAEKEQHLVIEGECYYKGEENEHGLPRGFNGREFQYIMLDDPTETVHSCTNLWLNDRVPEKYRDQLPDNARWAV